MQHKRILAGAGLLAFAAGMLNMPAANATAPPPKLSVSPSSVAVGEELEFTATCAGYASMVTSPGLAAPVTMTRTLDGYAGTGEAAADPGSHTATFTCSGSGGPAGNGTATVTFTITGPTPSTTTRPRPDTSTRPPAPTKAPSKAKSTAPAKPPQVKVLPKGAPETGDGTYAG